MSRGVRAAAPVRRRSHAERTAETRERVLSAVVESITEVGFQKTTSAEITRRAGLTWGAAQHHFGDKDGILLAVVEESFDRFAEHLAAAPARSVSLEKRVSLFVDRGWEHFGSAHYRSAFEILRNLPSDLDLSWQREMLGTWVRIWGEYFPESRPMRRPTVDLMHYAISVLSGLAATRMLEGPGAPTRTRALRLLKDTLRRELAR
jgi:AcrR family transcriptional regulator